MSTLATPQTSHPTELQACQAIAFQIAGHWLALPHATLIRVVHKTALNRDIQSGTLAYLGQQPLALLNLHPLLARIRAKQPQSQSKPTSTASPSNPQFLLIAALDTAMVGIPIHQLPISMELPLGAIHAVPPNYYKAIQGIASHVVAVPQFGAVFLLNLSALT